MTDHNDALERRARELFRRSCRQLPEADQQALRSTRLKAITRQPAPLLQRLLVPAGALAASVLALAVAWTWLPTQHPQPPIQTASNPQAADNNDLDMYENLDFYRWLASQNNQAQPGN